MLSSPRFATFLGSITLLLLGLSAIALADTFSNVYVPSEEPQFTASSTPSVLPDALVPEIIPFGIEEEATTTATNEELKASTTVATTATSATVTKKPKKTATPPVDVATSTAPVSVPVSAPAPELTVSSGNASLDTAASTLRKALVNIICYVPAGSGLRSMSGSGVVIDPKGIILTNAHIAQYLLLEDRDVSCTIRVGSPAVDLYIAKLIYISPAWLRANTSVLTQQAPTGTGEFDFAFLGITGSKTKDTLPSQFPFISLAESTPPTGAPIVIASYGAQFLEAAQIKSSLYPTIVFGSIKEVYTFALNSIDVFDLGGSAAAQEGSSGGGVADASGQLVGTITTSTVEGATDTRSLSAISASYIRSEYAREMNSPLGELLNESIQFAVADFAPQIPQLESIVTAQLQ